MSDFLFSPPNHCFALNEIDRFDVLYCPNNFCQLVYSQAIYNNSKYNIYTRLIPSRGGIKQFFETGTSLVSGKFRLNHGLSLRQRRTKLNDRIRFGSFFEWLMSQGKKSKEKREEFAHKHFATNSRNICTILTFTKRQSNIAIHLQIDCIFISFENVGYTQHRALAHQQDHLDLPSQQTNCTVC